METKINWKDVDPVKFLRDNYPSVLSKGDLYKENKELYYELMRIGKLDKVLPTHREAKKQALTEFIKSFTGEEDKNEEGNEMPEATKRFFKRNAADVAADLIGCTIKYKGLEATIANTAPFEGISKSAQGKPRFTEKPGYVWVNSRYGNYLLNINAYDKTPSCIVISAIAIKDTVIEGPGRVTKALKIDDKVTGTYVGDKIKIYR